MWSFFRVFFYTDINVSCYTFNFKIKGLNALPKCSISMMSGSCRKRLFKLWPLACNELYIMYF